MSRALGSVCSMSCVMLKVLVVLVTSTTGDAPVTVTVSCSVGELQLHVDRGREPEVDDDALATDVGEAGQLVVQGVRAGRQRREPVIAPARCVTAVCDAHQRRARRGDRDARQHRAGVVGDRPLMLPVVCADALSPRRAPPKRLRSRHRGIASLRTLLELDPERSPQAGTPGRSRSQKQMSSDAGPY